MPTTVLTSTSDRKLLFRLAIYRRIAATAVGVVAGVVLLAWVAPPIGNLAPASWIQMKANTALLILFCLASLLLTAKQGSRYRIAGRALAALVVLISALTFLAFFDVVALPRLDTFLAPDPDGIVPGRMSIQACVGFFVMGIALGLLDLRRPVFNRLADAAALMLCLYLFSFTGSLFFAPEGSPGWSLRHQLAPQSFFCLALLISLIVLRRTNNGIFNILVVNGIGGKTARRAAPAAILLPFLIAMLREAMTRSRLVTLNYAIAIAPAITSVLALALVLLLARRNRDLELAMGELSLRDELTGVYNRRGFNLLAQQAISQAIRSLEPFSVLFIDVDNLKHINDTVGHELGSEHLRQLGQILRQTFREVDIIGRVGGDEFVVASRATAASMADAVVRLQSAAAQASPSKAGHPLSFSYGISEHTAENQNDSLEALVGRADDRMYERKREKKPVSIPH